MWCVRYSFGIPSVNTSRKELILNDRSTPLSARSGYSPQLSHRSMYSALSGASGRLVTPRYAMKPPAMLTREKHTSVTPRKEEVLTPRRSKLTGCVHNAHAGTQVAGPHSVLTVAWRWSCLCQASEYADT